MANASDYERLFQFGDQPSMVDGVPPGIAATKKLLDFAANKESIDSCTHIGQSVNKTVKSFLIKRHTVTIVASKKSRAFGPRSTVV